MTALAPELHRRFSGAIERRFGIRMSDRPAAVEDIVVRRAAACSESALAYVERVEHADASEWRSLAAEVSVGETYFFRHIEQLHAFAEVAAELASRRGRLRVLSAGCSTGEEAYSLAMVARERIAAPVEVTGIDLNPTAIMRARRAQYSRWALRATTPGQQARWFAQDGDRFTLAPDIRGAVSFGEANLIDPAAAWALQEWDVVFCRNVLMYLGESHLAFALGQLVRALSPGGYLFLGHAETLRAGELELCHSHGTFYYRRMTVAPRRTWAEDIGAASERVATLVDEALAPRVPAVDPLAHIRALVGEERYADARERLAELPAAAREAPDAIVLAAAAATHAGDFAAAVAACESLVVARVHVASATYLLALCAEAAGEPARSEALAEQVTRLDPTFAMAPLHLAGLARRRGDLARSTSYLSRTVELLASESAERLALFGGGFSRAALLQMCGTELARRRPA